ncbi:Conserved_hypothetical protein [Hexamita inflata]|uniref:Uncharacterized protein n=1 Tax=Hexamita inflata TaxID=28002 RepID=A0AA86UNZ9_9EUKA|nr:Conserved hypothetical protein [Hexamita inflata]
MNHIPLSVQKAMMFFRTPKFDYDAYQSVIAAFYGPDDERCKKPRICGETEQVCGAIQAAIEIKPDIEEIIQQDFTNITKKRLCGELVGKGIISCAHCVRVACTVLEDYQQPVFDYKVKQWFEEVEDINKVFR